MKSRRRLSALVAVASLAIGVFVPIQASSADTQSENAYGLIVKYRNGVVATDASGAPTAEAASGVDLKTSEALGLGYYALSFAQPISIADASRAAKAIATDPSVATAELDLAMGKSSVVFKNTSTLLRPLAAFRAPSAARSLKVVDAWQADDPLNAQAKLSWLKPLSLYSAKLVGYKIESSTDGTTWKTLVRNSKSTSTNYAISTGLIAGTKYQFRVRAITQLGAIAKVGTASVAVSKSFATAPAAPVLLGLSTASVKTNGPLTIKWVAQTASETGGLPVTYAVVAKAAGQTDLTCTSNTNTCVLANAVAGISYRVQVTAKNSRGSATNTDSLKPADADYSKQWYLTEAHGIAAERAWAITKGSPNVVVAVLDTGITSHPELNDSIIAGYDFVDNDTDATDPGDGIVATNEHSSWHGTHVAGIIAAKWNSEGIAGIAPNVKIQPVRILGSGGEGTTSNLIKAINWAIGNDVAGAPKNLTPAKVINLSLASLNSCSQLGSLQATVTAAYDMNVTIISAAGNEANDNRLYSPTGCWHPISVGSSGFAGDRAYYSNYNVDITAPGGDDSVTTGDANVPSAIFSTYNSGAYTYGSPSYAAEEGTSMAAPVVSGITALLYSYNPSLTADQIADALIKTATPFAAGTWCAAHSSESVGCGSGIVNAANALASIVSVATSAK
ncbi:S8 family serine peptidase [Rhodoluna sp.]|uniref:S8 family serine peptidase n=1 Tax=Rhodoluna sp. TaxID=1969481 RepID=UPI0025F7D08F|nr:S8 family serine peptidase [Rhodoluna sp.]